MLPTAARQFEVENMATPVIVGAVRTAIGRSFKGTLVNTPPETLVTTVLPEIVRRSGVDPSAIDDIISPNRITAEGIWHDTQPPQPAWRTSPASR